MNIRHIKNTKMRALPRISCSGPPRSGYFAFGSNTRVTTLKTHHDLFPLILRLVDLGMSALTTGCLEFMVYDEPQESPIYVYR